MSKKGSGAEKPGDSAYVNEHSSYAKLSRQDRHALRDTLTMAFPIGKSSHKLWSDFRETTAFVRRIKDPVEGDPPEGILGGAIVMSYPEDQYDYLAYLVIRPDYRFRRNLFRLGNGSPHHGTELMRYIYDVMRHRVGPTRMQRYLMIEPAGTAALRFYRRALPPSQYPLRFSEEEWVLSVGYDGFAL